MPPIVGRERELSLVRRFLEDAGERACALHLHGEAGIGKSTLWSAAIAEADAMGFRIVTTRPTQAEGRLPFAGLNDLFGDLVDEVPLDMPAPQRAALDVAFLEVRGGGLHPEPLAISLAVLTLLRGAAERKPLILAIDDAPWLDESTASVLEFALRRLEHERIGVLVAERTVGGTVEAPIVSAMPAERVTKFEWPRSRWPTPNACSHRSSTSSCLRAQRRGCIEHPGAIRSSRSRSGEHCSERRPSPRRGSARARDALGIAQGSS